MRDIVRWLPTKMSTEAHGERTVYIKHWLVPFAGPMAAADTWFSVPAYIRVRGKRITGFVMPRDGMAYCQEHESSIFVAHTKQGED